ncbi:MAG: acyl-CoA synthetase [Mycobacterium sp.]
MTVGAGVPLLGSLTRHHPNLPDGTAVQIGDHSLSRGQLVDAAAAVASEIEGAATVAIDATASVETIVAVVGCLMAGAAAVPVPPDSGPAERAHILSDSGAALILGAATDGLSIPSVPVDFNARSSTSRPEPVGQSTAFVMYTSGTTGPPKGVVLSGAAVAAGLDGVADAWGWTSEDVLVHGLPLFHVHGLLLGVLGALRCGSTLIHTVRPKPDAYAAAAGSLYFGVPTVWSRICADPAAARKLSAARLLVSGSAPLPVPVLEELRALTGHQPIERYGMTETLITVSGRVDGERRAGWVGQAIRGVSTRLRDDAGRDVPHDGETVGHLQVAGPTLFDGYLGDPIKTATELTSDGWFATGDMAVIDSQGFHRIVGRESVDLIKSGGYRIGAGEVEHAILNHPAVAEAAVIGLPDDDLGQRIVAYIVGDAVDPAELSSFVATTLSIHKRPREIRRVQALPRNAMGKVQKNELVDQPLI